MSSNLVRGRSGLPVTASQRILVTGGAGFIGSHLCRRLIAQGHDVLAVDNFYSSTRHNVVDLLDEPRFELMRYDVTFPLYVEVDQIYHLACPASPIFYQRDPVQTTKTCVHGSINMLGLAKRLSSPILLASTSEIYGDPLTHPQSESYWGHVNPIGPRSVYDEAKRFSEAVTMAFHRYHKVDTRILRIFNTYGSRMQINDGRVIPNFMRQALLGQNLTVYGDGQQTRSFCYVSDEVDGIVRLARSSEHDPVNIGNPSEFTILECAQQVIAVTGAASKIRFEPLPQDDPKQRRPDITKARRSLGWEPKVDLESGLKLSLEYFRRAVLDEKTAPVESSSS